MLATTGINDLLNKILGIAMPVLVAGGRLFRQWLWLVFMPLAVSLTLIVITAVPVCT
ncbi:hypothetical protein [Spiroplasma endosymbiont of Agriotes lineatus]|uniref:hypothetical protein n=1 Tax=Spiroplasma endosymbiont of Agriotes lineatus TaxID=3077930 RepID=UPI0030D28C49